MKPFRPPNTSKVTRAIILACVAVQLLITLGGPSLAAQAATGAALIPARVMGGLAGAGGAPALLTPLTSLFLHANWLHLAMNLLFLGFVGRFVEWVLGPGRFVALYLAGGYVAGLAQVAANPDSVLPVVGASGAVAAVFAAYAVLFARRQVAPRRIAGVTLSSGLLTAMWFAAVWVGVQLMTGAVLGGQGIAIWSHIGGFFAGLVLVRPLARGARIAPL